MKSYLISIGLVLLAMLCTSLVVAGIYSLICPPDRIVVDKWYLVVHIPVFIVVYVILVHVADRILGNWDGRRGDQ